MLRRAGLRRGDRAARAASRRRSRGARRARSAPRSCGRSTTSPRTRCGRTWAAPSSRASSRASRTRRADGVYQRRPSAPQSVIDPRVAFIVRDMMRDAVERGTGVGRAPRRAGERAGGGQDRHDQRQRRRLVHGDDAGSRRRRVAGLRPAEDDHARRRRRHAGRADLGRDDGRGTTPGRPRRRRGRRRWAWSPRSSIARRASSPTPRRRRARRYTEYFIPGTEPEPLRSVPWKVAVFGALVP